MEEIRPYVLHCKDRGLLVRLAVDFLKIRSKKHSSFSWYDSGFTYYNAALK